MRWKWLEGRIDYSGSELRPHWCFEKTGMLGDVIVGFIGACKVEGQNLVDLEDRKNGRVVAGDEMLHLVCEMFGVSLLATVFAQRLLCSIAKDRINQILGRDLVVRDGDDLFVRDGKLSVSIATISPVSGLIHLGLNITTSGVPVRASCLKDLGVDARSIAIDLMERFCQEFDGCIKATQKVRPVM